MLPSSMDAFNAKRMTSTQIADDFVLTQSFEKLLSLDHTYIIGPRGSGKTTLLRMLTSEALSVWNDKESVRVRQKAQFASIFLPADELWASQTSSDNARYAFAIQLLLASIEAMLARIRGSQSASHLPVEVSAADQAALANYCRQIWGMQPTPGGLHDLRVELEMALTRLHAPETSTQIYLHPDPLQLLVPVLQEFNRRAREENRPWVLLLDEMELAPREIHEVVTTFVRGGAGPLTLKISMSPFDRYLDYYGTGAGSKPIPGHDFQTVYLSGQTSREPLTLTRGLWDSMVRARGFEPQPLADALAGTAESRRGGPRKLSAGERVAAAAKLDFGVAEWLESRGLDPHNLRQIDYEMSSQTIRKVAPLLEYRDALLNFRDGKPRRRSRKKSFEPYTGERSVVSILEGNPRWIKSAFSAMLDRYDARTGRVSPGFQLDALNEVANRFEALIRVLPVRSMEQSMPTLQLVDAVAKYLRQRNLGDFNPDPPNCFTVDRSIAPSVENAITLGLYSGAIVHVRDRQSPAVLGRLQGQRFRLTYLLSVRDGKELPLRLGKDVSLSAVLGTHSARRGAPRQLRAELPLDWEMYED